MRNDKKLLCDQDINIYINKFKKKNSNQKLKSLSFDNDNIQKDKDDVTNTIIYKLPFEGDMELLYYGPCKSSHIKEPAHKSGARRDIERACTKGNLLCFEISLNNRTEADVKAIVNYILSELKRHYDVLKMNFKNRHNIYIND